ncbi:MAG: hypothetical protein ACRDV4_10570 [Acidimicrobiales bacterium]
MGWTYKIVEVEAPAPSRRAAPPDELDTLVTGEVLRGVHDQLLASFRLVTDRFPPLGELQELLERKVRAGAPEGHRGSADLALAGFRGGWRGDGTGRLEADIFGLQATNWRWVGRAVLTVGVIVRSGSGEPPAVELRR